MLSGHPGEEMLYEETSRSRLPPRVLQCVTTSTHQPWALFVALPFTEMPQPCLLLHPGTAARGGMVRARVASDPPDTSSPGQTRAQQGRQLPPLLPCWRKEGGFDPP